jgi:hypothetical protein
MLVQLLLGQELVEIQVVVEEQEAKEMGQAVVQRGTVLPLEEQVVMEVMEQNGIQHTVPVEVLELVGELIEMVVPDQPELRDFMVQVEEVGEVKQRGGRIMAMVLLEEMV